MGKKATFIAPLAPLPGPAHTTSADELVKSLQSDVLKGLDETKVKELQTKYGPNQIKPPAAPSVSNLVAS